MIYGGSVTDLVGMVLIVLGLGGQWILWQKKAASRDYAKVI